MPDRTPFPFYTDVELRPARTYVRWRAVGLDFIASLDQRWTALRFTRKFWEFYPVYDLARQGVALECEVMKGARDAEGNP